MHKIDCRGLACPKPVINAKKALEEHNQVEILVDNTTARENLKKLGKKLGCEIKVTEEGNDLFKVKLLKGKNFEEIEDTTETGGTSNRVILIDNDVFGHGDKELGKVLIKGFIYTLTQIDPLPKAIVFVNSGVKLPTQNEDVIESLMILIEKGVQVLACGTCLDFYQIKDQLQVGQVSNMYEIVETLLEGQVITL